MAHWYLILEPSFFQLFMAHWANCGLPTSTQAKSSPLMSTLTSVSSSMFSTMDFRELHGVWSATSQRAPQPLESVWLILSLCSRSHLVLSWHSSSWPVPRSSLPLSSLLLSELLCPYLIGRGFVICYRSSSCLLNEGFGSSWCSVTYQLDKVHCEYRSGPAHHLTVPCWKLYSDDQYTSTDSNGLRLDVCNLGTGIFSLHCSQASTALNFTKPETQSRIYIAQNSRTTWNLDFHRISFAKFNLPLAHSWNCLDGSWLCHGLGSLQYNSMGNFHGSCSSTGSNHIDVRGTCVGEVESRGWADIEEPQGIETRLAW